MTKKPSLPWVLRIIFGLHALLCGFLLYGSVRTLMGMFNILGMQPINPDGPSQFIILANVTIVLIPTLGMTLAWGIPMFLRMPIFRFVVGLHLLVEAAVLLGLGGSTINNLMQSTISSDMWPPALVMFLWGCASIAAILYLFSARRVKNYLVLDT